MIPRSLAIMRHAKSSWDEPGQADFDRPLNRRGRLTASRVAETVVARGWIPQLVLCSSAARTRETWSLMAEVFPPIEFVEFLDSLYLPTPDNFLTELRRLPPEAQRVLIVSHNPGCESLVHLLTRHPIHFKTGDIAWLEAAGPDWLGLLSAPDPWKLAEHLSAKAVALEGD